MIPHTDEEIMPYMIKKILIIFVIIVFAICLVGPYLVGQYMIKSMPEKLKNLGYYGLYLNEESLKSPFCLLSVCFETEKATATVLNQTIHLGHVEAKIPVYDFKSIYFKTTPLKEANYLTLSGKYKDQRVDVLSAEFSFNGLKATLNGEIDFATKNILLKGNAINLKTFVAQFVPKQLKGFLFLLFQDSSMPVELDAKDQFLRINKIPFLPLQFF